MKEIETESERERERRKKKDEWIWMMILTNDDDDDGNDDDEDGSGEKKNFLKIESTDNFIETFPSRPSRSFRSLLRDEFGQIQFAHARL